MIEHFSVFSCMVQDFFSYTVYPVHRTERYSKATGVQQFPPITELSHWVD